MRHSDEELPAPLARARGNEVSWLETLRTGLEAVRTHRLRSALTVLGILIGIAAVILTVGLGEGAQAQVGSEITSLGTNVLTISPGSSTSSTGLRAGFGTASTLTMSDATALESKTVAPDISAVAPSTSSSEAMTAGTSNWTASVVGTTPSYLTVRGWTLAQGRFIDNQDVADHEASVVLGATTASELFSRGDPVGETVNINGVPMTVVGVLDSTGSSSSSTTNQDDEAIIPITTAAERVFGGTSRSSVSSIIVQAGSSSQLSAAYQEADTELLALHHVTTPADADFTITSNASLLSTATSVDKTLTVLLGGIAGISLLVGGIGVMNIMLVSVTERVREIGLRKALGATPRLIRRQFLVEASVLGLVGGALGALLGILGAEILPHFISDPISISAWATVGALLVAIAIGVIFGVYPASRAAHLAPIDALRSE
jgi:putative ABC transport system permease protein